MTVQRTRAGQIAIDSKLIAGTQKFLSTLASFLLLGQPTTAADVVAVLEARIEKVRAVETTRAAHQAAVQAEREEAARTRLYIVALRQSVYGMFGNAVDTLAEFGLAPRKARKTTPATQVVAAAKSLATRAARGTKGKRQKAKIKGAVTGPIVVVPQSGGSTAPVGAPEPAVSSSNGNGTATAACGCTRTRPRGHPPDLLPQRRDTSATRMVPSALAQLPRRAPSPALPVARGAARSSHASWTYSLQIGCVLSP